VKTIPVITAALFALAIASPSAGATTDLAGQWHLDEGAGTIVRDSSGHGNDGTILGGTQWTQGRFGSALSFDGRTAWLRISDNLALEPPSTVSVSAWVKSQAPPGDYRYIAAKGATGCIAASYGLYTGPNAGLEFYVSSSRGTTYTRSPDAGPGIWDGNWHMVIGTYDGSSARLFVDGRQIGGGTPHQGPLEYLLPDSNDFYVGDYPGCQQHNFAGTIDELNVWSGALSSAEVLSVFTDALNVPVGAAPPLLPSTPSGPSGPNGSGGTGGTGGTGTGGSGGVAAILRGLKISPASFALDASVNAHGAHLPVGTTISYTVTQPGRSTFTLYYRQAGRVVRGRCTTRVTPRVRRTAKSCVLYTRVASFTRVNRSGTNSFRFTGIRGVKLRRGTYRLDVTPSSSQRTGKTASGFLTIVG
jgi:Concanavalin A-like lectin/glucanases superfamily